MTEGYDPRNRITNFNPVDIKSRQFTEDGIFSPRIFGRSDEIGEVYECFCRETIGRFLIGDTCPNCGQKVEYQKSAIERYGWIELGDYKVVAPYFFHIAKTIIGEKIEKIISYEPSLDVDGHEIEDDDFPYKNVGLKFFINNFFEIVGHYHDLNKKKQNVEENFKFLKKHEKYLFIDKIPVYSNLLRPAMIVKERYKFAEENTMFNQIIHNISCLNNSRRIEKIKQKELPLLAEIQVLLERITNKIINTLIGKNGNIRSILLGNRINFSVRTIISPLPTGKGYKINEVAYPYLAAVELFKFEIINILTLSTGSIVTANRLWNEAVLDFSPTVYSVLEEIRKKSKGGMQLIMNRNPSIDFGSILSVMVAEIKKNYFDLTMGVPNNILRLVSGDFDGDVLTTIAPKDMSFKKFFSKFDPRNLIISNNDGRFNLDLGLDKDYKLGFNSFVNL